jgi:hypothetical protein
MTKPSRSDQVLYERALSQGWDIPAELRTKIIKMLGEITSDGGSTKRERTAAARALVQASRVELDAIRVAMLAQFEDMTRRLAALEGGSDAELANATGED